MKENIKLLGLVLLVGLLFYVGFSLIPTQKVEIAKTHSMSEIQKEATQHLNELALYAFFCQIGDTEGEESESCRSYMKHIRELEDNLLSLLDILESKNKQCDIDFHIGVLEELQLIAGVTSALKKGDVIIDSNKLDMVAKTMGVFVSSIDYDTCHYQPTRLGE